MSGYVFIVDNNLANVNIKTEAHNIIALWGNITKLHSKIERFFRVRVPQSSLSPCWAQTFQEGV
jgi:hypothetical protein